MYSAALRVPYAQYFFLSRQKSWMFLGEWNVFGRLRQALVHILTTNASAAVLDRPRRTLNRFDAGEK